MSTEKKLEKKRKRQSPPALSEIGRRLEKFRNGQRNLWADDDDDDDDDDDSEQNVQHPKTTTSNETYIVLSDSDEEKSSSRRRKSRTNKARKKSSQIRDESLTSDTDNKPIPKCATCLICSILTTLTSYNCCSRHLSVLVDGKNSCHNHQKHMINTGQWPPQQVMIVPMTDEFMQRYLDPQKIHSLRTQTSTSPINKKTDARHASARKLSKKSTMTSQLSDVEQTTANKSKSSAKSSHVDVETPEQTSSSSIVIESALPNSGTIPIDTTFTIVQSTSTTINSFESPNTLDTCQLQQSSSDQPIIIDDSQSDSTQENLLTKPTNENKQNDPWTPISDETYAAIEIALEQPCEDQTEFTPSTARRISSEQMASCLPKIQLRQGRFRRGKPIAEKNSVDTTNEQSSVTTSQSSTISITSMNTRPPPLLATIVEDESLIVHSIRHISEKSPQSCHVLSERHENTSEELSDTIMSRLLAQDEASQHDNIPIATKILPNEAPLRPPPPAIIVEDCSSETEINQSADTSQSSQLTNDQNDTQHSIPSTTNEKPTPTRISYRMNPDGSRVSISRPPLPTGHQSPVILLRRTSTDVAPIIYHTKT